MLFRFSVAFLLSCVPNFYMIAGAIVGMGVRNAWGAQVVFPPAVVIAVLFTRPLAHGRLPLRHRPLTDNEEHVIRTTDRWTLNVMFMVGGLLMIVILVIVLIHGQLFNAWEPWTPPGTANLLFGVHTVLGTVSALAWVYSLVGIVATRTTRPRVPVTNHRA